jgi:hypothetical protein
MNEQNKAQSQANFQANEQSSQANNQSNQQIQQMAQQAAKAAEAKTILNGQEVKVKEAQAAEEAFNRSQEGMKTGIQAHHDNSSEAVEAGKIAQNAQQNMQTFGAANNAAGVKAHDLQSGQAHLQQHIQQAQQSLQQLEQEMQQQEQQRMQQAQQAQQQMEQKTQGLSEEAKVNIEAHQQIQGDLDAKAAKAKANKKG